ncbi:protein serine/threonine phosphatase 2C [Guyanagaster necrorhizus]|uniref:Protein serine/threonine phosphatase 2C n=1 Tax=Guyanagaster necrorhizus TaxID=856835 RepID=A0A9P8ALF5_9AGAR|nr:protein serine/threonine phosphatase 2C [Guyanagaster necrorhizus MCA 3950]KAG7439669.1 protein serine/threonine phosphatase 2C [Guyanagaster necrorhizus MCA 3950]
MCSSTISAGIHCVTFQPTPGTTNQDRFVAQEWDVGGRRWKFLAVLDGHGGNFTAEYSAATLPGRIEEELRGVVERYKGRSQKRYTKRVQEILSRQIYYFDKGLGDAIKELCPDPSLLDDEQARNLVNANKDVFQRALSGSTLAIALLDNERNHLWVAGLGDSTVGLAYMSPEGYGDGERLLTLHSTHTPLEYFTIVMRHPTTEKTTIIQDERLLGIALPTRGLGDYPLKFEPIYTSKLFFMLPCESEDFLTNIQANNKTPPYVMNIPDTRFIDLAPLRDRNPTLVLFTDGVDIIVDGETLVSKNESRTLDPAVVVGKLLGREIDPGYAQETLGHDAEANWMGSSEKRNRATELLGNLMAGTSKETFASFLGPAERGEWDDSWYFDDTTILLYDLQESQP